MVRLKSKLSIFLSGIPFVALCLFPLMHTASAESDDSTSIYSPVVNGEGLRGLSTIGSAEPMGEGRITFGFMAPWYRQKVGYLSSPNAGTDVFTGAGAFSYGVSPFVDLFASVAAFSMSKYTRDESRGGLGTIRAGAQGSWPFPQYAFLRMGAQTSILGGTSQNQINTFRADGYNYFETRTNYSFMGKLLQTARSGNEDYGLKLHLNEAGVIGIAKDEPALLLLGAGLQVNAGFVVLGAEINSRTRFNDLSFGTDPLWFTPSLHIRTPYEMNAMLGVDISLSSNRSNNDPRALEPYRVFGEVAFSFDMLAKKRLAEAQQKQKAADEKLALENKAAQSALQVKSLKVKSREDSLALINEVESSNKQMDQMQLESDYNAQVSNENAAVLAKKAIADSLALMQAASNLAEEKSKRSDAEKQLLSTGELLLDAVYFETGKTIISINSKPYLNIIGKMLLKYPKLQIEVAGHTDNIGSQASNVALSQGRAEAVRLYLINTAPTLSSQLIAHGYGMDMPKASNASKEGRLANRRVELRVTNKDALQQYN